MIHRALKLSHHTHSGRRLPHHHTSYAVLAFMTLVVGVLLSAITTGSMALDPKSGQINLGLTVSAPPPPEAPTISSPTNNQRFEDSTTTVSGTCESGDIVRVYRNGEFAGSTTCQEDGTYSLDITLFAGRNELYAQQFDALDQGSPRSVTIAVFYDTEQAVTQFFLRTETTHQGIDPSEELAWPVEIVGGRAPYALSWNWGDGTTDIHSAAQAGPFTAVHTYTKPGTYQIVIKGTDVDGQTAQLEVVSIVNGALEQAGPTGKSTGGPKSFLQQIAEAIQKAIRAIEDGVVTAYKLIPPAATHVFPYFLFLLLIILGLLLVYAAHRERRNLRILAALVDKEKAVAQEKKSFIMLASHYLRTPITIINLGIELAAKSGTVQASDLEAIKQPVSRLSARVEELLKKAQDLLADVPEPERVPPPSLMTLVSPYFVLPVVAVGAIFWLGNYIFINVRDIPISTINQITQWLVYAVAAVIVYIFARMLVAEKGRRHRDSEVLDGHVKVDGARNNFIRDSIVVLNSETQSMRQVVTKLPADKALKEISEGVRRLDTMLAKFDWLSKVESRNFVGTAKEFNLRSVVRQIVRKYEPFAKQKGLSFKLTNLETTVRMQEDLLYVVLESLVDNAVKYSKDGEVEISYKRSGDQEQLFIKDQGVGITREQIEHMFEPFGRSDVEHYNQEGIGFSLYLNKVIMDYLGGGIRIESTAGKGTTVRVSWPVQLVHDDVASVVKEIISLRRARVRRTVIAATAGVVGMVVIGFLLVLATIVDGASALGDSGLAIAWPLYILAAMMLLSFWLGEKYEVYKLKQENPA